MTFEFGLFSEYLFISIHIFDDDLLSLSQCKVVTKWMDYEQNFSALFERGFKDEMFQNVGKFRMTSIFAHEIASKFFLISEDIFK